MPDVDHPSYGRVSAAAIVLLLSCAAVPSITYAGHGRAAADEAAVLAACPLEGDARSARVRDLNILKRRRQPLSPADIDGRVSLAAMLVPGDDTGRFDVRHGATLEGYVADVKVGGVESVNCHTHDPRYRDTHIELTLAPEHDAGPQHVIVEVTPQWREVMAAKGVDWSTSALRRQLLGRWIRVTGWLLFDAEHADAAVNTAPGARHIWRATVWELHPVTAIEVLPGRP